MQIVFGPALVEAPIYPLQYVLLTVIPPLCRSVDRKKMLELASCIYVERAENIIFLGPPCTGKIHLAVHGIKAIQRGYRTLFCSAANLVASLTKAYAENRLEEKLKTYTIPRILIIDESVMFLSIPLEPTCCSNSFLADMRGIPLY